MENFDCEAFVGEKPIVQIETFEEYYKLDDGQEATNYIDELKDNFKNAPKDFDWLSHVFRDVCGLVSNRESLEQYTVSRMNKTIDEISETCENKFIGFHVVQQLLLFDITNGYYHMLSKYKDMFPNEYIRILQIAQACYDIECISTDEESMFKILVNVLQTVRNIQDRNIIIKWLRSVFICHNEGITSDEYVQALDNKCSKVLKVILDAVPKAVLPNMNKSSN